MNNKLVDDEVKNLLKESLNSDYKTNNDKSNLELKEFILSQEDFNKKKSKYIKKSYNTKNIYNNTINSNEKINYTHDIIYNKNAKWIDNKVNNNNLKKKYKEENETLKKYNFKPNINNNTVIYNKNIKFRNNGVEKFLERQKKAKIEKLRKLEILSSNNSTFINQKFENKSKNKSIRNKSFARDILEIAPQNYIFDTNFRKNLEGRRLAENINSLHKYLNSFNLDITHDKKIFN